MLPDPSQDLLPFGGTFRHLAIQFLAQPPASPSSPSPHPPPMSLDPLSFWVISAFLGPSGQRGDSVSYR